MENNNCENIVNLNKFHMTTTKTLDYQESSQHRMNKVKRLELGTSSDINGKSTDCAPLASNNNRTFQVSNHQAIRRMSPDPLLQPTKASSAFKIVSPRSKIPEGELAFALNICYLSLMVDIYTFWGLYVCVEYA